MIAVVRFASFAKYARWGVAALVLATLPSACSKGDSLPHLAANGANGSLDNRVSSKQCSTEGAVRDGHVKVGERDGYLSCYTGQQVCQGGVWGPCGGSGTLSSRKLPPGVSFASESAAFLPQRR